MLKQGQPQPYIHSKAGVLIPQLWNGLLPLGLLSLQEQRTPNNIDLSLFFSKILYNLVTLPFPSE